MICILLLSDRIGKFFKIDSNISTIGVMYLELTIPVDVLQYYLLRMYGIDESIIGSTEVGVFEVQKT